MTTQTQFESICLADQDANEIESQDYAEWVASWANDETPEERAAYEAWLNECEDVLGDTYIGQRVLELFAEELPF